MLAVGLEKFAVVEQEFPDFATRAGVKAVFYCIETGAGLALARPGTRGFFPRFIAIDDFALFLPAFFAPNHIGI